MLFSASRVLALWKRLPRSGVGAAALLAGLTVAVGMAKYGLGLYSGASNLFEVTVDPWTPELDPSQDFVLRNASFAFLLGLVGMTNSVAWISIHVLLAVTAVALPFFFPVVHQEPARLKLLFVVLVGGPVLPVILGWVGAYDAWAVIGLAMAVLARRARFRVGGWLLVGLAHVELGFVAAFALTAYTALNAPRHARGKAALGVCTLSLPPLVFWAVLSSVLVASWGGATSRVALALANFGDKLYRLELVLPAMLFSILGVSWLLLLRRDTLRLRSTRVLLAETLILVVTLPFLIEDYTRILGMLLLPLVLSWIIGLRVALLERLWKQLAVAAVIIPIPVFIAGTVGFGGLITFMTWRTVTQL